MKYSKSTGCFYPSDIEYSDLPSDLISVTQEQFSEAMARAAGDTIDVIEGKFFIVPAPVPDAAAILGLAKSNALTRIDNFHSEVIARLVGNPTQTEKDTWAMKLDTANAIASGQSVAAAGAAFLRAAGLNDAAAQSTWARTVMAKSTGYAQVVGVAERLREAAKTAVKAASDEAGVQAALDAQHTAADAAVASISKS